MKRVLIVSVAFALALPLAAAPPEHAIKLRNQGIAELENETPVRAESTFRQLVEVIPGDPLPYANLAIAMLRQQKLEEAREWIAKAHESAGADAKVVAIEAEIHHWSGESAKALAAFQRAAKMAPDNVDIQYSLFRQATSTNEEDAGAAAAVALTRLAKLRPENLVVLLQLGRRAREAGDRTAATAVYLRIRELIWQAPRGADGLLDQILESLEADELDGLRGPALRLENVLKITPMYKEGLRELSSGIQGTPIATFRGESRSNRWGSPADVRFVATRLTESAGVAVAVGDLDGDEEPEIARIRAGESPRLEIRDRMPGAEPRAVPTAAGLQRLALVDLDNDGIQELLGYGPEKTALWRLDENGSISNVASDFGLDELGARAVAAIDFDIEGDLDLALAGDSLLLLRNTLEGKLQDVSEKSLPRVDIGDIRDLIASDLDRDGDLDLLVAQQKGLLWLDNLRQGRFADRSTGLPDSGNARRISSADFDNDGLPDLVIAGKKLRFFRNVGGRFEPWSAGGTDAGGDATALAVFDADNDGLVDVAVGGSAGVTVLAQRDGRFEPLPLTGALAGITSLVANDVDSDGDLDLVTDGPSGLVLLTNEGGNQNRHLSVRLRGLNKGNSKNNVFGLGSVVEVKAGSAYQFREARGESVHFGLGSVATPDLMRVVWTNGVPQNRLQPEANQRIVEEQVLKGSCPFLYADSGNGFEFVTDLLWGAPLGLPIGEDRYLSADPTELVYVGELADDSNRYEIRITEELWEAAFFDFLRVWIVDHPKDVEVASSLRVQPGASTPERVHASRSVRPVATAWDAAGEDVTGRVRSRDEVYADGWRRSAFQGVAAEEWSFTFDLGAAPGRPIRLLLDGWIFPTDASLNLALAQRRGPQPSPPRLEVEGAGGWRTLMPSTGFPAGKTKTMVIDTPPLPEGARRLRIVSGQWLSWDRIAWTDDLVDETARVVARLTPSTADLRYRGFSALLRRAPNAPHVYDYEKVDSRSPWLPFPGRYTRYGDVRELLLEPDDRSVILAPGDEMAVVFEFSDVPPPSPDMVRSVFLESHGWDKDADRNTGEGVELEPLPFRAMNRYPYGPSERFPMTPLLADYVDSWLTRVVSAEEPTSHTTAP